MSAGAVTGTGTAADPLKQETIYRTGPAGLLVTQTTSYVNGSQFFTVQWAVKNTNGTPYAGRTIRYFILGVNAGAGSATVGADGSAVITDPGAKAGADTVVAFLDFNNNGTREVAEPQASALATLSTTSSRRAP